MSKKLTTAELIELVERIMLDDGDDEEIVDMILLLKQNTMCPDISNLIFYSDPPLSAKEVVNKALDYKPIILPGPGG